MPHSDHVPVIRIGCSGWNYRHWRGAFYPDRLPVKRWFAYYAERFKTVEINNSFYRLPSPETFAGWREQAPPGFRYSVKAPRFLTHMKKLKDAEEPVARLSASVEALGDRLGPILYQLPPRWSLDLGRLRDFLALVPRRFTHVFEFREESWHCDAALALLAEHGASFCTHDFPDLRPPRIAVGPVAYVRFHGAGGKYWGRYSDEVLAGWRDWMLEQVQAGREVWAYFNNDWEAAALADALNLKRLVDEAAAPA